MPETLKIGGFLRKKKPGWKKSLTKKTKSLFKCVREAFHRKTDTTKAGKSKEKSGSLPEEKSGSRPKEKSGSRPKEKSGSLPKEKSDSHPKEKSGSHSKEKSGSLPKEKSDSHPKEKSGSHLKEKSGSHPKEKSGSLPKEKSGSHLKEKSGSHPKEKSGSLPKEKSDSHPKEKSGSLPKENSSSHPKEKSGSLPKENSSSHPKEKSGSLPKEKSDSHPKEKSGSLPKENSGSHPKEKSGSLPKEKSDSHPKEKSGSLPKEKSGSHPKEASVASLPKEASETSLPSGTTLPKEASGTTLPKEASGTTPPKEASGTTPPKEASGTTPPKEASGTSLPKEASGTTPPKEASGTTPPKEASGTSLPKEASGTSFPSGTTLPKEASGTSFLSGGTLPKEASGISLPKEASGSSSSLPKDTSGNSSSLPKEKSSKSKEKSAISLKVKTGKLSFFRKDKSGKSLSKEKSGKSNSLPKEKSRKSTSPPKVKAGKFFLKSTSPLKVKTIKFFHRRKFGKSDSLPKGKSISPPKVKASKFFCKGKFGRPPKEKSGKSTSQPKVKAGKFFCKRKFGKSDSLPKEKLNSLPKENISKLSREISGRPNCLLKRKFDSFSSKEKFKRSVTTKKIPLVPIILISVGNQTEHFCITNQLRMWSNSNNNNNRKTSMGSTASTISAGSGPIKSGTFQNPSPRVAVMASSSKCLPDKIDPRKKSASSTPGGSGNIYSPSRRSTTPKASYALSSSQSKSSFPSATSTAKSSKRFSSSSSKPSSLRPPVPTEASSSTSQHTAGSPRSRRKHSSSPDTSRKKYSSSPSSSISSSQSSHESFPSPLRDSPRLVQASSPDEIFYSVASSPLTSLTSPACLTSPANTHSYPPLPLEERYLTTNRTDSLPVASPREIRTSLTDSLARQRRREEKKKETTRTKDPERSPHYLSTSSGRAHSRSLSCGNVDWSTRKPISEEKKIAGLSNSNACISDVGTSNTISSRSHFSSTGHMSYEHSGTFRDRHHSSSTVAGKHSNSNATDRYNSYTVTDRYNVSSIAGNISSIAGSPTVAGSSTVTGKSAVAGFNSGSSFTGSSSVAYRNSGSANSSAANKYSISSVTDSSANTSNIINSSTTNKRSNASVTDSSTNTENNSGSTVTTTGSLPSNRAPGLVVANQTPDAKLPRQRKISPTSRLKRLLSCIRKNSKEDTPLCKNKSTQLSLNEIDAGYLNGGGIVGLTNLGNTCYMNSMVQCLSHTLELTDLFLCNRITTSLCSDYRRTMRKIWLAPGRSPPRDVLTSSSSSSSAGYLCSPGSLSSPGSLKSSGKSHPVHSLKALKANVSLPFHQFSGYKQQDAQEYLFELISAMHGEMRRESKPVKKGDSWKPSPSAREQGLAAWRCYRSCDSSPISDIFMGQLKSTLRCEACHSASLTFDPCWDLALPIAESERMPNRIMKPPVDLHSCFSLFTKAEVMDGSNKPFCSQCQKKQKFMKTLTVQRFPPVLILYLKRFATSQVGHRSKLNTPVNIHQTLDLSRYSSPETVEEYGADAGINYSLYAICNHYGSLYGGHYTSFVKYFATQKWYTFNDAHVTEHSSSHVTSSPIFPSTEAYVLFYRRI